MAKRPQPIETFVIPAAQPQGDPFINAFTAATEKKQQAKDEFLAKRESLMAEYVQIVWRKARNQATVSDAARLVELADSEHLTDMRIDGAVFSRHVETCQRWQMKRDMFMTVESLQKKRDASHAKLRELQDAVRRAETDAGVAASELWQAHEADADSRTIAKQNVLFFDPVTNSPRDGSVVSIDDFVAANSGKGGVS